MYKTNNGSKLINFWIQLEDAQNSGLGLKSIWRNGMGFPNSILLYEQIKILMGSICLNETVGKLIIIQLQWIQMVAGVGRPILESNKTISYLTTSWIQSLHVKLVEERIQLRVHDVWVPHKTSVNDQVIMEYVI